MKGLHCTWLGFATCQRWQSRITPKGAVQAVSPVPGAEPDAQGHPPSSPALHTDTPGEAEMPGRSTSPINGRLHEPTGPPLVLGHQAESQLSQNVPW